MKKVNKNFCDIFRRSLFLILPFLLFSVFVQAQEIMTLYPSGIPNSKPSEIKESGKGMYKDVTIPTLEYFKPNTEKASGTAVIIVPGGGYSVVVYNGEGVSTAKDLGEKGIATFVLKYRLPNDAIMIDKKNWAIARRTTSY